MKLKKLICSLGCAVIAVSLSGILNAYPGESQTKKLKDYVKTVCESNSEQKEKTREISKKLDELEYENYELQIVITNKTVDKFGKKVGQMDYANLYRISDNNWAVISTNSDKIDILIDDFIGDFEQKYISDTGMELQGMGIKNKIQKSGSDIPGLDLRIFDILLRTCKNTELINYNSCKKLGQGPISMLPIDENINLMFDFLGIKNQEFYSKKILDEISKEYPNLVEIYENFRLKFINK